MPNPKPRPNHQRYIEVLRAMSPKDRLNKAFEMSAFCKSLFLTGLRRTFPNLGEEELHHLYLKRLEKCHNRKW